MQRNHELTTDPERNGRLPILAVLWDELARIHKCAVFEREFQSELEHLDRFRNDYPKVCPKALISILEATVIDVFRARFPRKEMLALRVRLNQSN